MNGKRSGWLLPTAACAYVAAAALEDRSGWALLGYLFVPFLGLSLVWLNRLRPPHPLADVTFELRLLTSGVALFAAASFGSPDHPWLKAASGIGQALATSSALVAVRRLKEPEGLLRTPRAAVSLDALVVLVLLWSLAVALSLSRVILPELTDVAPPTIDTAYLFSALGSLLLLVAVLLRTRILRGLELGIADRAAAGLWLAVAGTAIGGGSGFLRTGAADWVSSLTLVLTSGAVTYCLIDPRASRVSRFSRSAIALALLGAPTTLLGAHLALQHPDRPVTVTLSVAVAALLVGLFSHRVSRPLGPAGSRWLEALTHAMTAALHPEPDLALRGALAALSKAEGSDGDRPELFRFDPPRLVSVDVAGYLTERPIEFPQKVFDLAKDEPGATLRRATVVRAQVRRPDVRSLVGWFSAHKKKSATALSDSEGPVGLLTMPQGRRSSPLSMEEVEMLSDLAERLTGVVSVTSSLARAHQRQLSAQDRAKVEQARSEELLALVEDQSEAGRGEAARRAEAILRTAHGPAARMALAEIERHASAPHVHLNVPPGGDAVAWAACLHLERGAGAGAFVVVDAAARSSRTPGFFSGVLTSSPLHRLTKGTLVIVGSCRELGEEWIDLLAQAGAAGVHVITSGRPKHDSSPTIDVPSLADRAEDLASIVNLELARIGLETRGDPFAIQRVALSELLDRPYPGNEAELLGLLHAACAQAKDTLITLEDIHAALGSAEQAVVPPVSAEGERRRRHRPAPRSRR